VTLLLHSWSGYSELVFKFDHAPWSIVVLDITQVAKVGWNIVRILGNQDNWLVDRVSDSNLIKDIRISTRAIGYAKLGRVQCLLSIRHDRIL
jgi:hypothetical protein